MVFASNDSIVKDILVNFDFHTRYTHHPLFDKRKRCSVVVGSVILHEWQQSRQEGV